MPLLDDAVIRELCDAAIAAGLFRSRGGLLAGIDSTFVAGIDIETSPAVQLKVDLDALNKAGKLSTGKVPLGIWLGNAVQLAGPRSQAEVFARAGDALAALLAAVATAPVPPPAAVGPRPAAIDDRLLARLSTLLAKVYPREDAARFVLARAGIDAGFIDFSGAANLSWFNVLKEARSHGKVAEVFAVALDDYPANTELQGAAEAVRNPR
jgi:hypothetical protein